MFRNANILQNLTVLIPYIIISSLCYKHNFISIFTSQEATA